MKFLLSLWRALSNLLSMGERRGRKENHLEREEVRLLKDILRELRGLKHFVTTPHKVRITQGDSMAIQGIPVGATKTFGATALPEGTPYPAGTTFSWASSDTANTAITPSADGSQVAVALGTGATVGGSTTLSVSVQLPAAADGTPGAVLTDSQSVPYLPGITPPPPVPTGVRIDQLD